MCVCVCLYIQRYIFMYIIRNTFKQHTNHASFSDLRYATLHGAALISRSDFAVNLPIKSQPSNTMKPSS